MYTFFPQPQKNIVTLSFSLPRPQDYKKSLPSRKIDFDENLFKMFILDAVEVRNVLIQYKHWVNTAIQFKHWADKD